MKIIVKEIPFSKVVTVGVYIRAGSFHERNVYGTAHFVEHMLFSGTKNRTSKKILYDIEGVGGELDASTTYDYTEYIVTIPFNYWINAIDVLTDMLFNYDFEEKSFIREKKIILDELGESQDDPSEYLSDLLQQKMFKDYPNRQLIAGTPAQVKAITKADLYAFLKEHYTSDNMYLVVTGNVSYNEVFREVSKRISPLTDVKYEILPFHYPQLGSKTYTYKKDIEQFYWGIGMFGPSFHLMHTKECYAMEILTTILGGNSSSRLFQVIREERGLAYTVDLTYEPLSDVGLLSGIFSSSEEENIAFIKEIVLNQLEKIKKDIRNDEIERAKAYLEGIMTIRSEGQMFLNNYIGESLLYSNQYLDINDYIRGIRRVDKKDIIETAEKYFQPSNRLFIELAPK
ncbi:M16 family metallopeptidase [Desulfolucanica intricata]|uniref:M16 family metallopeptidase n=1 Tax=Desulfolucanica intricata TaxID=1285191 RepID=UPI0008348EA6|nr:pitrilysin family protein [Desulfolucanica intricata]